MTKTPTTRPEQAQEVTTFEDELKRIVQERARYTHQIAECQKELATLAEREQARQSQEEAAQRAVDSAREAHREAEVRSEILTEGALAKAAKTALSGLEKHLRTAQDSQLKLLNKIQQEADADQRKAQHLQEDMERAHQTLATLDERERHVQALREKAHFEQAEAALHSCMDTLRAMEAQRDIQRSTLANMDEEVAAYIQRAQMELSQYPEQQQAFSAQFIYNDALTGILQGQIDFIDLVLATGRAAREIPIEVARKAGTYWQGLSELLALDAANFRPALARESTAIPDILIERRELLTRLLALYRETKA